jgi:hypothetical protein
MTQTATPAKQTAFEKRCAFIKAMTAPIQDQAILKIAAQGTGIEIPPLTVEQLTEIAVQMAAGTIHGRTMRWKTACGFAKVEIDRAEAEGTLDQQTAQWAVVQGSVFMAHGA